MSSISYSCCCCHWWDGSCAIINHCAYNVWSFCRSCYNNCNVTSLSVATIAILSTLGSSTLNIIDTWGNIDNSVFNTFQNILNWTSTISNCFYSIGSIYSSVKGISNADLRNYGKQWITNHQFRSAISGASEYNFTLKSDSSTFWSGIGDEGICNGNSSKLCG